MESSVRDDLVRIVEDRLELSELNTFQTNFLSSMRAQLAAGKILSEKQITTLDKIIDQTKPDNFTQWSPTEEEISDIDLMIKLSASYSSYYLNNYNISLRNALQHLDEIRSKIRDGRKVVAYERKYFEKALHYLSAKMKKLKSPSAVQGDLCFHKNDPCVVLTPAFVNSRGEIVCLIDAGGNQTEARVDDLKKRHSRR